MARSPHQTVLALTGCAGAWLCAPALAQTCSPYWTQVGGVGSALPSVATFDDGSGLALYSTNIPLGPVGPTYFAIARWNGHGWTALRAGLPPGANAQRLTVLDDGAGPRLYAGGVLYQCCDGWLLRWNGQSWEDGPPGFFSSQGHFGPGLSFDDGTGMAIYGVQCAPNTCQINREVRWTGTSWVRISAPPNDENEVTALGAFNLGAGRRLYAFGLFNAPGGGMFGGVAMWDGAAWQFLGSGLNGGVRAMCQYDDGRGPALYVGGNMTVAGGVAVHQIARWDSQTWSDVGGGITSGGIAQVNGLTTFDDGRGAALYASGYFGQIGGVNAHSIARWDGHAWEALGNGFYGPADSFAVFNDGRGPSLFVAGNFDFTGGGGSTGSLVQWVGCPNCYANCDNSTRSPRLNVLDFMCFLNKFAAQDPYANCTVDATIDVADFVCFMGKFAAGCP